MRGIAGPAIFLWPCLYALHALLIVAGAPILFTGVWGFLNVLLPLAGYGFVTALVGHFYGRFALRKLKEFARPDDSGTPEGEQERHAIQSRDRLHPRRRDEFGSACPFPRRGGA